MSKLLKSITDRLRDEVHNAATKVENRVSDEFSIGMDSIVLFNLEIAEISRSIPAQGPGSDVLFPD